MKNEEVGTIRVKSGRLKIGVIVPTYIPTEEHHAALKRAIESLNAQVRQPDEVIFVINGTLGVKQARIAETIKENCQAPHKILNIEKKCGIAAAKNHGVRHMDDSYDFIASLDIDDAYHPEKLRIQEDYLLENQQVDILGTLRYHVDPWNNITEGLYSENQYRTHEQIKERIEKECVLSHGSTLIRRTVFIELGGYNEDYVPWTKWPEYGRFMGEDWDLWIRAIKNGYRIENLNDRLYYYTIGLRAGRGFGVRAELWDKLVIKLGIRKYRNTKGVKRVTRFGTKCLNRVKELFI